MNGWKITDANYSMSSDAYSDMTKQKENIENVLPDPQSVRYAHQVASCYIEGKIGEEMVKHNQNVLTARWD